MALLKISSATGGRQAGLPAWRTIATVVAIVITAVLILEFGVWYFVGLIALYGLLDISERIELRREARNRAAILSSVGQQARNIGYVGSRRHCEKAAWVAKRLGWIACPMRKEGLLRYAVRFKRVPSSGQLSALLEALHETKLATRIRLPLSETSFGQRLSAKGHWTEQAFGDAAPDIKAQSGTGVFRRMNSTGPAPDGKSQHHGNKPLRQASLDRSVSVSLVGISKE